MNKLILGDQNFRNIGLGRPFFPETFDLSTKITIRPCWNCSTSEFHLLLSSALDYYNVVDSYNSLHCNSECIGMFCCHGQQLMPEASNSLSPVPSRKIPASMYHIQHYLATLDGTVADVRCSIFADIQLNCLIITMP